MENREIKFRFWTPDKRMLPDHDGWTENIGINEAIVCSDSYNYIMWRHPKKKWKEPVENELVCRFTGMTMRVIILDLHTTVDQPLSSFKKCECHLELFRCTNMCEHLLDKYEGRVRHD